MLFSSLPSQALCAGAFELSARCLAARSPPTSNSFFRRGGGRTFATEIDRARMLAHCAAVYWCAIPLLFCNTVGRLEEVTLSVCMCLSQHFFGHVCPPHSTYTDGTKASPDGSCAHTNSSQLFLCWFRCKSLRNRRGRCGNVCCFNMIPLSLLSDIRHGVGRQKCPLHAVS